MNEDWWVPGGAVTSNEGTKLRLRPPESWTRVVLDVWMVPPSMNTDKIRGWRSFYKLKRAWQDEIETLLMMHAPGGRYQRALAGCFMRFPDRKKRRDPPNFRAVPDKALGDALVTRQLIPDDDEPHYFFAGIEFDAEIGDPRTWIHVFLQPIEEQ